MRTLLLVSLVACASDPAGPATEADIHKHAACTYPNAEPSDVCEAACANPDNYDSNITCAVATNPDDPTARHDCRYGTTVFEGHIGCCDIDTVHPIPATVLFYECE